MGSLFLDMAKFYEVISHQVLLEEAAAVDFPLALLKGALELYSGPRAIVQGRGASDIFECSGTILPGCSMATTIARVMLQRLLLGISEAYPRLYLYNVVDDLSFTVVGSQEMVARELGQIGLETQQWLRRLRLPLSQGKSKFMGTSPWLTRRLGQVWGQLGWKRCLTTRNLGTDAAVRKTAWTPESAKRLVKAARRARRVAKLRADGAQV